MSASLLELCVPGGGWRLAGSPRPRSLVRNLSHTRSRCSFSERPLIRFLSPSRVRQVEGGTVFRKATGQRIQRGFVRASPGTYASVKNLQFWGILSTLRVLPIPSLPRGHKDHYSAGSFNSWKFNWYSSRLLDLLWVIWRYTDLSGTLVQCSTDEVNTPFGVDLGEGAIF